MSDNQLDQEFDVLVKQINAKVQEAAQALKEANALCAKTNLPGLINSEYVRYEYFQMLSGKAQRNRNEAYAKLKEMLKGIDVETLEREMSKAGWSTSSSYC